ncbi:hypothetical protein Mgra_00005861 [Meloidogyne graminicola]|uniref:Uncharacterized protein n=1 Tax=Meloidogyne graminicola TaxID=189291 RepID=A0A8S9ZND1_9BILA|nr:hypothetical protein Mgra_00005861 [Meloidogyne graminicola]
MFSIPLRQLFCSAFVLFSLIATIVYVTNIDNVKLISLKSETSDDFALDERNKKLRNELNQIINNLIKGIPIENDPVVRKND